MKMLNEMDQYLKGNLSEEELDTITKKLIKTHFEEKALKTKWKKLLADDKELLALKQKGLVRLPPPTPKKKKWIILIGIAASLFFLLATYFISQQLNQPEPIQYADVQASVDAYLDKPVDITQTRKNLEEEGRVNAMRYYEARDYPAAIKELKRLVQTKSVKVNDYFNLGYFYLKQKEWDKASINFNKVINHPTKVKIHEARWFASLAFIKNKEPQKAIDLLEEIVSRGKWKVAEAKKLLYLLEEEHTREKNLGFLKYAVPEVRAISEHFKMDTFFNEEATKANFLKIASESDLLHLSMHSISFEENSFNSSLVFSSKKDSTDFQLTAGEIYNLRLNAALVSLSACNTADGQLSKRAGIRTLSIAFQYAGVKSLIASLWNIEVSKFDLI